MNSRAFRVAMLHMSQNEDVSPNEETPQPDDKKDTEQQITLNEKKKVIDDSLDSYYSPVINAYLRKYDDLGQLMVAAQYIVSMFDDSDVPVQEYHRRVGNIKVKVLNAVGDTALDKEYSLKQKFLNDPQTNRMGAEQLDSYIRTELGKMKRDATTRVKKIEGILVS